MGTIIDMGTLKNTACPFEDYGCDAEDYVPLDTVVGKEVMIYAVKEFENDKGPGVYVLLNFDKQFKYICTHSITITAKLTSDAVKDVLKDDTDDCIRGTFIRRKSQKSDRMVYDIE